ncbi:MAG: glutathione S-transferase [Limimaricola sp.]|uniref:glutathione S-transferase n=1 Tax=Limimaricola sp. TaxID=2211665 RepID=UPI001D49593A|nr:glutathione S-transferase [Limimaricola sp.]MBI1417097.1 glutathione S-transferase [Limimaricola sp.]
MQLLMSPASPFVRKVRVLIREAGIDGIEEINVSTTPLATDPAVMAANPAGKIPALVRDDGPALYDSRVITRYLDAQAGAGLYPAARLWEVLTVEATADAMLDAAVLMVYEARFRAPEMQSADWVEGQWGKVSRAVTALNEKWMSHLSGPLDMGQIAVACALSYLDFRHPGRDWRGANPALADWYAEFATRDSMVGTAPA